MSKHTPTQDVFDRLAEQDDPDAAHPGVEPDGTEPEVTAGEATPDDEIAAVEQGSGSGDETGIDEAEEADSESDDEATNDLPPGTVRRRVVAVLIGVIMVAALGLSAFLGWRLIQVDQTAAAGRAALEAAKNYAVALTTLDVGDIDKNYSEALAGATGQFKDEYSQGSAQLRQILIDNNASGKGVVLDGAVKSATKTKVEVLLFVDQSVENAVLSAPRLDRNRVQMTMELVDNRWLASTVDII